MERAWLREAPALRSRKAMKNSQLQSCQVALRHARNTQAGQKKLTTLTTTRAATAVTGSTTRSHGSLGLNTALGGVGGGLVDSLDGGGGLSIAIFVVA